MDVHVFSIGEAAEASGLTVKTIRYYEEAGLIPKAARHDASARTGGNRLYGQADIGRLRFIHHARMLDLSLGDIGDLLEIFGKQGCPGDQPDYQRILARHLGKIDNRITHLLGLRKNIEDLMSRESSGNGETCSWDTCDCMRSDTASPSPTATDAGRKNWATG